MQCFQIFLVTSITFVIVRPNNLEMLSIIFNNFCPTSKSRCILHEFLSHNSHLPIITLGQCLAHIQLILDSLNHKSRTYVRFFLKFNFYGSLKNTT